jgi:hypothetical protein
VAKPSIIISQFSLSVNALGKKSDKFLEKTHLKSLCQKPKLRSPISKKTAPEKTDADSEKIRSALIAYLLRAWGLIP